MPLSSLDVDTGCPSTIFMIENAHRARPILNWITIHHPFLCQFASSHNDFHISATVANFLQTAASLTECQSGSHYAMLSMKIKAFRCLGTKCKVAIDAGDPVLKPIAETMLSKIEKYDGLLCNELPQITKLFNPIFGNDSFASGGCKHAAQIR